MLQSFANHLIGAQQVVGRDALTVWRIGHHDTLVLRLGEVLEVLLLDSDIVGQTSSLDVETGRVDSLDVYIVAVDMMVELTFLRIVVVNLVKEVGIEVGPLLEGKLLAEQARSHVSGNKRSLDEQCARTTHGINEIRLAMPARHQDDTCSQYFVDGGFDRLLAIAATMQRLATGVKAQSTLVIGNMYMQTDVGI